MLPKKKATPKTTTKKTAKANKPLKKGKDHTAKARKTKPAQKAVQVIAQAATPRKPKEQVAIAAAKGRPMLTWVGKRPLLSVTPFPAQQIESLTFPNGEEVLTQNSEIWKDWPPHYPQGGLLFHGDNKEVLAHLLANGFRGKVHLIYIDPPFDSGADYIRKVSLRGTSGTAKLAGEDYSLGEQIQYTDIWAKDNYLQFLYERLILLKELLSEEGAIVVHCDWHQGHRIRLILDEVFAEENFRNEIVWHYGQRTAIRDRQFDMKHDNLFFYAKSRSMVLAESTVPWSYEEFIQHRHDVLKDEDEREFIWTDGGSGNERYKRYVDEVIAVGKPLDSVWDLPLLNSSDQQRQGFPTQKPDYLLERVVRTLSKPGGIVLDCFIGSGTTAAVAQKLGRRWIGCDINKGAVQTTAKRLQTIIQEQIEVEKHAFPRTVSLPGMEIDNKDELPKPAQFGFSAWRVNNYDLAIQHNEAVNLACEHIGVTRTLSDSFFNGTLGQKLVKIIPFGHPLSLTDLEDVRAKIESRPNDSRDVVMVCLGKELGVDAWLGNWNRMRKQGNTPNKIEVIELRTDPKYGKFFAHKPAQVRVKVQRADGKLTIEVQDFISPSILERLQGQAGPLLAPKVTDWRAMVDSIMIDPTYDGKIFNIAMADVPGRKQDLVQGRYELSAPKGKTVVAVKVTDMLGEEVLVQQEV